MSTELKIFTIVVTIMILVVTVSGFLVFSSFLNREEERAKRFRTRRAGDKKKTTDKHD